MCHGKKHLCYLQTMNHAWVTHTVNSEVSEIIQTFNGEKKSLIVTRTKDYWGGYREHYSSLHCAKQEIIQWANTHTHTHTHTQSLCIYCKSLCYYTTSVLRCWNPEIEIVVKCSGFESLSSSVHFSLEQSMNETSPACFTDTENIWSWLSRGRTPLKSSLCDERFRHFYLWSSWRFHMRRLMSLAFGADANFCKDAFAFHLSLTDFVTLPTQRWKISECARRCLWHYGSEMNRKKLFYLSEKAWKWTRPRENLWLNCKHHQTLAVRELAGWCLDGNTPQMFVQSAKPP